MIDKQLNLPFTFMNTFQLVVVSSHMGLDIIKVKNILNFNWEICLLHPNSLNCLLIIMSLFVAEHHRSLMDIPKRGENSLGSIPNPLTALIAHFALDSVDLLKDV